MLGAEDNESGVVGVGRLHSGDKIAELGVEVTEGLDEVVRRDAVVVVTRALLGDGERLEVATVNCRCTTGLGPSRTVEVVAHGPVLKGRPVEVVITLDFRLSAESIDFREVGFREPETRWSIGDGVSRVLVGAVGVVAMV